MTSRKIYREKYYQAWRFGLMAEGVASLMLRLKGYRILARRFRTPLGEIDLVARRGRTVAFLEVKARADFATAAEAVTIYQQRRIINAAQLFLAQHPGLAPPLPYARRLEARHLIANTFGAGNWLIAPDPIKWDIVHTPFE